MIAIRVDSNDIIATGHVMRCLAIAEQFQKKPLFICSEQVTQEFLMQRGYECICLHNRYNQKNYELDNLSLIIKKKNVDLMLIDSYEVTEYYFHALHKMVRLAYIDDLIQFYYDVDLIINYTYKMTMADYEDWNYSNVEFLLGSKFAPLRKQFLQKPIQIKSINNVLLTTGGTDNFHIILDLVKRLSKKNYTLHIVLGKFYDDCDELGQFINGKNNITVYRNVDNIAQIMKKCDIAISAGGTTLIELATLGIPTICFSIADNQLAATKMYANDKLMKYAGDVRADKQGVEDYIIKLIAEMEKSVEERSDMARRMVKNFDGMGARRIAEQMENLESIG